MERDGDFLLGDDSHPEVMLDCENSVSSSNLLLDNVGKVILTHDADGLSWTLVDTPSDVRFLGHPFKLLSIICFL